MHDISSIYLDIFVLDYSFSFWSFLWQKKELVFDKHILLFLATYYFSCV